MHRRHSNRGLRVPSLALLFVRAVACTLRPLLCCTFAACSRRPPLRSAAKQLGLSDEEIAKWKLAVVSFGRVEYLEEDEVVKQRFRKHDNYGNWDDYLGLEHAQVPRRAPPALVLALHPPSGLASCAVPRLACLAGSGLA